MTIVNWRQQASSRVMDRLARHEECEGFSWKQYHEHLKAIPFQLRRNGVVLGLTLLVVRCSSGSEGTNELRAAIEDLIFLVTGDEAHASAPENYIPELARLKDPAKFRNLSRDIHEQAQLLKQTAGLNAVLEAAGAGASR